jgi:hypothetical protein
MRSEDEIAGRALVQARVFLVAIETNGLLAASKLLRSDRILEFS